MEPIETTVRELERFDGRGWPVLSVYLLTDPSTAPGRNLDAQLDGIVRPLAEQLAGDPSAGTQFAQEVAAVERFLAMLDTPPRSLAIFSSTPRGFFRALRLPVQMAPQAFWGPTPHLRPLQAVLDEFEPILVLLVDKERARFFRVALERITEIEDLADAVPGKHRQRDGAWAYPPADWAQGGWGDAGIERHHETHVLWHAQRVAETLERLVAQEQVGRVLVGGTPEVLSVFYDQLPKELHRRIVGEIHVPLFARPAEVLASVHDLVPQIERAAEERLVQDLVEEVASGRAVVGTADVLRAVSERRVQLLVYAQDLRLAGGRCAHCGLALLAPLPPACPVCGGSVHPVEDFTGYLAQQVLAQGGRVEEVRGPAAQRLQQLGGIAARVRYALPRVAD